jgi:hypothetical protein
MEINADLDLEENDLQTLVVRVMERQREEDLIMQVRLVGDARKLPNSSLFVKIGITLR